MLDELGYDLLEAPGGDRLGKVVGETRELQKVQCQLRAAALDELCFQGRIPQVGIEEGRDSSDVGCDVAVSRRGRRLVARTDTRDDDGAVRSAGIGHINIISGSNLLLALVWGDRPSGDELGSPPRSAGSRQ